MNKNTLATHFLALIERRETQIKNDAHRWEDETDEQFAKKITGRINVVAICTRANELPGVDEVLPRHGEIDINGLKIWRRCVDEIDNVWAARIK